MNYLPICFVLAVAILFIIVGVPPSLLSKAACLVLGAALMYFGYLAGNGSKVSWEDELEAKDRPDAGRDDGKDQPPR